MLSNRMKKIMGTAKITAESNLPVSVKQWWVFTRLEPK